MPSRPKEITLLSYKVAVLEALGYGGAYTKSECKCS